MQTALNAASNGFIIKLRNIPSKDIGTVLELISRHFKFVSIDIRKRGGC